MTVALELTANKQHAKIHFDFCINGPWKISKRNTENAIKNVSTNKLATTLLSSDILSCDVKKILLQRMIQLC